MAAGSKKCHPEEESLRALRVPWQRSTRVACRPWRADGQLRGQERWTKVPRHRAGQGWRRGRGGGVGCNAARESRGGGAGGVAMRLKRKARPCGHRCEWRLWVSVEVRTASRRASGASDEKPAGRSVLPGCSNCIFDSRTNGSLVSLRNNQIEHKCQQTTYQKPRKQYIHVF